MSVAHFTVGYFNIQLGDETPALEIFHSVRRPEDPSLMYVHGDGSLRCRTRKHVDDYLSSEEESAPLGLGSAGPHSVSGTDVASTGDYLPKPPKSVLLPLPKGNEHLVGGANRVLAVAPLGGVAPTVWKRAKIARRSPPA